MLVLLAAAAAAKVSPARVALQMGWPAAQLPVSRASAECRAPALAAAWLAFPTAN